MKFVFLALAMGFFSSAHAFDYYFARKCVGAIHGGANRFEVILGTEQTKNKSVIVHVQSISRGNAPSTETCHFQTRAPADNLNESFYLALAGDCELLDSDSTTPDQPIKTKRILILKGLGILYGKEFQYIFDVQYSGNSNSYLNSEGLIGCKY